MIIRDGALIDNQDVTQFNGVSAEELRAELTASDISSDAKAAYFFGRLSGDFADVLRQDVTSLADGDPRLNGTLQRASIDITEAGQTKLGFTSPLQPAAEIDYEIVNTRSSSRLDEVGRKQLAVSSAFSASSVYQTNVEDLIRLLADVRQNDNIEGLAAKIGELPPEQVNSRMSFGELQQEISTTFPDEGTSNLLARVGNDFWNDESGYVDVSRVPDSLRSSAVRLAAFYKDAWDESVGLFKYDGSAAKFAGKLTLGVVTLGLGVLESAVQAKKHGILSEEFATWAAQTVIIGAIAIPIVGTLASAIISAAPTLGPIGIWGLAAVATYKGIKELAEKIVTEWADEPDSFIFKAASAVLDKMNSLEDSVSTAAKEALDYVFDATLQAIGLQEVVTADGTSVAYTFGREDILLYGSEGATLLGGENSDLLVHSGFGEVFGEAGDDVLIGLFPKTIKQGERIGVPPSENEIDLRTVAQRDMNLILNGGDGDDQVITILGEKAITIGGLGRDWIFNTSKGGVIFGDTIDGQNPNDPADDLEGPEHSDNIWWWPDVTVVDARPNDVLKFFGFPMVGGNNNLPVVSLGPLSSFGLGLATFQSQVYFDFFLPFMTYFPVEGEGLYVSNIFTSLFGSESLEETRGSMLIENFNAPVVAWGVQLFDQDIKGDLGLIFKMANPILALLALIPMPAIGGIVRSLPMIDELLTLSGALARVGKALEWSAGTDPLVIDLDGDGIETNSLANSEIYFDLDGDFFAERTGWLDGDDGFLALDRNGNGVNGGVKFGHCGGAKVGQFGASALERAALI
ncbi:hypothetical protein ACSSV8_004039 [Roseovarius sp. MBR-79]